MILTKLRGRVGSITTGRSHWEVKMKDGSFLSELDEYVHVQGGERRTTLEWYDDLVANGDVLKVRELWLFCPPNAGHPLGQSAQLVIKEPGTAFVLNGRALGMGSGMKYPTFQLIGRVDNKENGVCACFVYDHLDKTLYAGQNCVYNMIGWREGVAPLGPLALDVVGLRL